MSLLKHCADGNLPEIEAILRPTKGRRNKVQICDNHNWTCLHHAVKSESVECIKFLLTLSELDTTAETFEGETALHIACNIPNIPLAVVSALIDANPNLVYYVNNEEVDLLKCAITRNRLDIVKLLISNGAPVNKQDLDGDTALHIAAIELQLDVIRYLLYDALCDSTIRNEREKTACFLLFAKLLVLKLMENTALSPEEIDCFEELAQFTYNFYDVNNPNENELELNQMISFGYIYDQPRSCLYTSISKLFSVPPSKQYFFHKIMQSNVSSCHCLIISLLQHINTDNFSRKFEMWDRFLRELFELFLSDETFFNEYISEIVSSGYALDEEWNNQAVHLCEFITLSQDSLEPQKLFSFFKALILYGIDFHSLMLSCEMLRCDLITVFAPLAKLVVPLGTNSLECDSDLHETGIGYQVVSLKNLCRMSFRRYCFKTYSSHYTAIKVLHSLNVPIQIRNILCYNVCNLKF